MMRLSVPSSSLLALSSAAFVVACGASKPIHYDGDGTSWELALVDPGSPELVVEGAVHGQGPFLFVLDPDSPRSVIDDGVARRLDLYSDNQYVRVVNQRDVSVPRKFYEVLTLDIGELHVRNVKVLNAPEGALMVGGRTVHGVLGADLLSRTIVVRVDREKGKVALALTGHQTVPAGAAEVRGHLHYGSFYVPMTIGDQTLTMQVRLSSSVSTLRANALEELGLAELPGEVVAVDETGAAVTLPGGGIADVRLDGVDIERVRFYRHEDKRERFDFSYDGVIGQDILSRFHAVVDRDQKTLHLATR